MCSAIKPQAVRAGSGGGGGGACGFWVLGCSGEADSYGTWAEFDLNGNTPVAIVCPSDGSVNCGANGEGLSNMIGAAQSNDIYYRLGFPYLYPTQYYGAILQHIRSVCGSNHYIWTYGLWGSSSFAGNNYTYYAANFSPYLASAGGSFIAANGAGTRPAEAIAATSDIDLMVNDYNRSNSGSPIYNIDNTATGFFCWSPSYLPSWTISTSVSVDKAKVFPGDTINWTHNVANNGPNSTVDSNQTIWSRYWNADQSGNAWNDNTGSSVGNESHDYLQQSAAQRFTVPGINKCLDINGGASYSNGTAAEVYDCNGTQAQTFMLENGAIVNTRSDKCIDSPNNSTSSGTKLQQYTCNGTAAQQFYYQPSTQTIRHTGTGLCVDRPGGGTANNLQVQLYTCNGTAAQQWNTDNYGDSRTFTSSYTTTDADLGRVICRRTSANPHASNDGNWVNSDAACATVVHNYQITETGASQTSTNSDGTTSCDNNTVTVGTSGTIKWALKAATSVNGHDATNSRNITWKVVDSNGNTVASNAVNSAGTSVSGATGMIFAPGQTVTITAAASTQTVAGQVTTYSLIVTDGTGGGTSTSTIETDSDSTITSTINKNSCSESVKSPSVQINGADSRAQTGFQGSNVSHVATNGSWSQYGLLSNSNNFTNFGSAGYVANGDSSSCKLWFANATGISSNDCSGSTSGFALGTTFTRSLPTVKNLAYSNQSIVNLINLSDGVYAYAPTNNTLMLSQSSDISTGEHITIYVNGNISITSDIWLHTLSETYSSLNTIPSLTIYATGNINIYAGVSYIDANLISKNGTINDCSTNTAGSSLSYSENGFCDNQLVIDGSISTATTPHFTRTRGAEQDGSFMAACGNRVDQLSVSYSTPAECISYSPNLYLVPWFLSQKNSGGDINWQTIDETSLPARY